MSYIFISYSKKNSDYAQTLKSELIDKGFSVWIDEVIEPSDEWFESIVKAIEGCTAFLVIMTPESRNSRWVKKEILLAHNNNKPVFPLLLEGQNWPLFVDIQYESVNNNKLPSSRFYEKLSEHAPQQPQGHDITLRPPNKYTSIEFTELLDIKDVLPSPFDWIHVPNGEVTFENLWNKDVDWQTKTYTVDDYLIAQYPITNAQFEVFILDADGYENSHWWAYSTESSIWRAKNIIPKPSGYGEQPDYPRVNVTWFEAVAFCLWLSARTGKNITLPTEQQWQRAAQGDTSQLYPWGNTFDLSCCNFNSQGATPVYKYPSGASPYGVIDMSGNVWEWCLNDYDTENCDISIKAMRRVLRGGSWWSNNKNYLRTAARNRYVPDFRLDDRGFRIVTLA